MPELSWGEWLVILIVAGFILPKYLKATLEYFGARPVKPPKPEKNIDMMHEVTKLHIKSAKINGKQLSKHIQLVTDGDTPLQRHKIYGLNPSTRCCELVWKPGFLRKRLVIVPWELMVDVLGKIIQIRCRGFTHYGGTFYRPIFNNNVDEPERNRLINKIDSHVNDIVNGVDNVNAYENDLNSVVMASQTEWVSTDKLRHWDHNPKKGETHDYEPEADT